MRVISKSRDHFRGTHKGCEINIERDRQIPDRAFYITVQDADGYYLYDGWSPREVRTMPEAKREALYGAMLATRPKASRHPVASEAKPTETQSEKGEG